MNTFILADKQELTRFAIEGLLRQNERNTILHAPDRLRLTEALRTHEHSVVVLDFSLSDFTEVSELLMLSERFVMASWVLIDSTLSVPVLRQLLYASSSFSVVFKDSPLRIIREALSSAAEGRRYICQRAMEQLLAVHPIQEEPAPLTPTELSIAKAIARGKTTKEIANERFSSIHTITTHRKNIFQKLKVNSAHEVIKYALHAGWIDASDLM
ncbi:MAG: response regulator transcription factor [Bacteroidaceae bacterium]|nr:response regulator transcription factor [Bacteroidaceae bacterium]